MMGIVVVHWKSICAFMRLLKQESALDRNTGASLKRPSGVVRICRLVGFLRGRDNRRLVFLRRGFRLRGGLAFDKLL